MASNYINQLQDENVALKAEIAALDENMAAFRAFLHSSKFSQDTTIQVADVLNWMREIRSAATDAHFAALMNENGPKPAASYTGWVCPECHESLRSETPWNDTDAKVEARMRDHWRAAHRVSTAVLPSVAA